MPDLENMEKQLLEKSFEEGEPNGDVEFANLKERLLAKVVKQVEEQLRVKGSMKIQLGVEFQLYRLTQLVLSGKLEYQQADFKTIS